MDKTLLLVEDDRTLMKSLQMCLRREGWEVTGAASVEEAGRHLVKRDFDLVVTDYQLSTRRDGLCLLANLIRDAFGPPAILISGNRTNGLASRARELGAYAFLHKPFDLDRFLDLCGNALAAEPGKRELHPATGPAGS